MVISADGSNVTESALARIYADLLTGRLRPGDRIKVDDLSKTLGYNLSAVREALSRLTSEGLVSYEPHRGYRATPISLGELRDLTATRVEMEAACLRSAIASGDLAWETAIVAALHSLLRTAKPTSNSTVAEQEAWFTAHNKLHEALVAACTSPLRLRMRGQLYTLGERYRRISGRPSEAVRDIDREHREIVDAVLARDADRAAALMSAHLELTATYLIGEMSGQSAGTPGSRTGRRHAAKTA